jgi:CRP/FNR family transcriptional regulator, cyclic AMP receptor protein
MLGASKKKKKRFRSTTFDCSEGHGQVRKRVTVGQVIYSQGDAADAAFFVESGCIKESTVVRNGGEAVLALCGPGEFFGTRCMLDGPRTATATALIDSSVVRITTAALHRMLRETPDFAEMFAIFLVQRSADDQEGSSAISLTPPSSAWLPPCSGSRVRVARITRCRFRSRSVNRCSPR